MVVVSRHCNDTAPTRSLGISLNSDPCFKKTLPGNGNGKSPIKFHKNNVFKFSVCEQALPQKALSSTTFKIV